MSHKSCASLLLSLKNTPGGRTHLFKPLATLREAAEPPICNSSAPRQVEPLQRRAVHGQRLQSAVGDLRGTIGKGKGTNMSTARQSTARCFRATLTEGRGGGGGGGQGKTTSSKTRRQKKIGMSRCACIQAPIWWPVIRKRKRTGHLRSKASDQPAPFTLLVLTAIVGISALSLASAIGERHAKPRTFSNRACGPEGSAAQEQQ